MERKYARVLLVDDMKVNFFLLTEILVRLGFTRSNISIADNGFDALAILRDKDVDLVITDLEMPRINGMDLIKEIKNNTGLYKIPVILNSGTATPEIAKQAILFGAIGFFPKPYDIKEIEAVIAKIFPS